MALPVHQTSSELNQRCRDIAHPDIPNFVLSILILIGILVSYLPQHWRIISRRSSEGLSPYFILLGTTSGTCAIANILVLPTSRMDVACCAVNSASSCAAGLLGIAQVGVQWSCFFLITLLFLIFIPRQGLERRSRRTDLVPRDSAWRTAVLVVAIAIVHFILTFLVSVIMLARYPKQLLVWANVLGTTSAIVASIQYLPQIWTTWRHQHIGSLSIPMMCIQTPGSFVFATSLAIRLGAKGWSAWIVYIVTGSLQAILLVMAIMFERRDRKNAKRDSLDSPHDRSDRGEDSEDETDPLIERDRLAERQRQLLVGRHAAHPLHPDRLNPEPMSSSSEGSPGDRSGSRKNQGSSFAELASNVFAPFRRSSTRWYDASSRRQSRWTTEGDNTESSSTAVPDQNAPAVAPEPNGRRSTVDGRRTDPNRSRPNGSRDQRNASVF